MTICQKACAAVFASMLTTGSTALAQKPGQSPPNTTGCTPQEKSTTQNLGQKLNQSNGVICPPDIPDRGGVKSPPAAAGNTPVIPPPGSPGGNPRIQPK